MPESPSVSLSLDQYNLLKEAVAAPAPQFAAVTTVSVEGTVKADAVELKLAAEVLAYGEKPIEVPLYNETLIVTGFTVTAPADQPSDRVHCIRCADGHLAAVLNGAGRYSIEVLATLPLTLKPHHSFSLCVPKAVSTALRLSIPGEGYDVKVGNRGVPATVIEDGLSVIEVTLPPTCQLQVQWSKASKTDAGADDSAAAAAASARPERVIASQHVVYNVGETHVMVQSSIRYLMENASRKEMRLAVPPRLRIVSVHADALQEWNLVDGGAAPASVNGTGVTQSGKLVDAPVGEAGANGAGTRAAQQTPSQVLLLTFDYNLTERTLVTVHGEVELPRAGDDAKAEDAAGSPPLAVPLLHTLGANRERGVVAVEASANVEVQEASVGGLQPIDAKDLPTEMQGLVTSPLLMYKYLDPRATALTLAVTKHNDTEVLVTAIDEGHFETTVAQEGKILTRCLLKVRNTQRQFLRATLPDGATIWSTLVGGAAIKPGVDANGQYMIALRQSGANAPDEEFVVELLFLTEYAHATTLAGQPLGMRGRGRLELTFPRFDIPINHLFVTARLPKHFKYGEFKGALTEVKSFSHAPAVRPLQQQERYKQRMDHGMRNHGMQIHNVHHSLHQQARKGANLNMRSRPNSTWAGRQLRDDESIDREVAADFDVEFTFEEPDSGRPESALRAAPIGAKKAGVTPVRVALPMVGQPFYFEKLLVVTEPLNVAVNYSESKKGWFARRSVW